MTPSQISRLLRAILIAALFVSVPEGHAGPKRPHVVLFIADDLGWADCSVYSGKDVATPNMAKLAARGKTFSHAFVASPSCAPSRAALLTGLYPMRNGAMLNHSRSRPDVVQWPAYFRALGYTVAAIGKVSHYGHVKDLGFDHASHFNYHQDDCIDAAVKWLASRKSDDPVCLLVGTNWPHVPWPKKGGPDPDKLSLPPTLVDTPETRQARSRYLAAVANADRDLGIILDAIRKHLGDDVLIIFTADHGSQFPFGKWNLYDAGVRSPLIVAWPGRVPAGSTSDALVSWVDLLPTCLEAAGGKAPAETSGQSFLPVLLGKKAAHRDRVFFSHSGDGDMNRYPMRGVRDRDWRYVRNLDPDAKHHSHVDKGANPEADGRIYWDSWIAKAKTDESAAAVILRYHTRPAEELYHLKSDPWELKNLAGDPAHADALKMLRGHLDRWMAEQGDEGLKTERGLADPREKKKEKQTKTDLQAQAAAEGFVKAVAAQDTVAAMDAVEVPFFLNGRLVKDRDDLRRTLQGMSDPMPMAVEFQLRYAAPFGAVPKNFFADLELKVLKDVLTEEDRVFLFKVPKGGIALATSVRDGKSKVVGMRAPIGLLAFAVASEQQDEKDEAKVKARKAARETVEDFLRAAQAEDLEALVKLADVPWYEDGTEIISDHKRLRNALKSDWIDFAKSAFSLGCSRHRQFGKLAPLETTRLPFDKVVSENDWVVILGRNGRQGRVVFVRDCAGDQQRPSVASRPNGTAKKRAPGPLKGTNKRERRANGTQLSIIS